jgi:hypothetical protein
VDAPSTTKAMITLANGKKISIDSLTNVRDGNIQLIKNDKGEIIYAGQSTEVVYNTLDNPKGSTVASITLIDGTKVWLNAASSLKYFTSSAGTERKVEITGEAYFEVTKDKQRPFIVQKGETSVTVLGTHFNVNAYDDEEGLKVTLLEGAVKVKGREDEVIIKPGEQARISYPESRITLSNDVNLEEVMAWKNGRFNFDSADLKTIMRQLVRWYNIEVVYENDLPVRYFTADMSRDKNLSSILKILEANNINYKLDNKKLTIMK